MVVVGVEGLEHFVVSSFGEEEIQRGLPNRI
jgi:hypothetical protein